MPKLDRILELVDDLTQDQTAELVEELFQILDEEHFQKIRLHFFPEDEDPHNRDSEPDAKS